MVRSTVDYYTFNVKLRKKSPNIPRSAVNLGNGRSILPYLYGYIDYQRGRIIKEERKQRLYAVRNVEIHGRLILIELMSGQYGEESQLMNMLDGSVTDIPSDQAAVKTVRVVFACPIADGATNAIFAIEHVDSINGYYFIQDFAKCIRKIFSDSNSPIHSILEKEAWFDSSSLVSMAIPIGSTDQQITLDNGIADEDVERTFGRMSLIINPPKGSASFDPRFWKKMLKHTLEKAGMLTIPALDNDTVEKTNVSVTAIGADNRRKTFTIGNEKSPKVRELITDYGQPRLDNGALRRHLADSILDKYAESQIKLQSGWDKGQLGEELIPKGEIDWANLVEPKPEENNHAED